VIITSPSFDETPSDKTILVRFLMNVDENSSCFRLSDPASGSSDFPGAAAIRARLARRN